MITYHKYDNTPLIDLQKGLYQNGSIWKVLGNRPSVIKLYHTMVAHASLSPNNPNKKHAEMFKKHTKKPIDNKHYIICWLSYTKIEEKAQIKNRGQIKNAIDYLVNIGLIQKTDDDGVYRIGYVEQKFEDKPTYKLFLHDVLSGTKSVLEYSTKSVPELVLKK